MVRGNIGVKYVGGRGVEGESCGGMRGDDGNFR